VQGGQAERVTMLKTGDQHLESLRDGRTVYIGKEKVTDVTAHLAFRNAARSMAAIYDMKAALENRDAMTFEENGKRFSKYFLKPKSRQDLEARSLTHRRIAEMSYGMLGRSPDHVSSFVTGMATKPEEFGRFAGNLTAYTSICATTIFLRLTRCCRRKPRVIRISITGKTFRCRRYASSKRPTVA
jgi:aromatic ring hydroxylase